MTANSENEGYLRSAGNIKEFKYIGELESILETYGLVC
jgi:hypothetical protein